MNQKARALFLSHGGGPLPLLGDAGHQEMVETLRRIAATHRRPAAIVLISAHWEAEVPTITSGGHPGLIYDYYGFPEASYAIEYPCPGEPRLAEQIHRLLGQAGIEARLDAERGFDHGLFVPLKLMYPEADIPCVQLSLVSRLDPAEHLAIGQALQGLDGEDLLVIGSGFSFHNLRAFFAPETPESAALNAAFEQWLLETCASPALDEAAREQRLIRWQDAPAARFCHPREEHLLPLHVCYGLTRARCAEAFEVRIMGKRSSLYRWAG